jgi:hypothetical protein
MVLGINIDYFCIIQMVFVMETPHVFCEIGTKCLNTIERIFMFQNDNQYCVLRIVPVFICLFEN